MKTRLKFGLSSLMMGVAVASLATGAYAQEALPAGSIEEIVVTAQKRAQNIQNVPIAVTAISDKTLQLNHIQSTADLGETVPGLWIGQSLGNVTPRIRGVGNIAQTAGIDNSVATYVDGVYMLSLSNALSSLNDVKRVEVLKGPQGTLYGRNATGGVINIITKEPSHTFSGNFRVGYGNYDTYTAGGYLTGGLSDTVATSLSVFYENQVDGYYRNHPLTPGTLVPTGSGSFYVAAGDFHGKTGQHSDLALRSKTVWTPTDNDKITLEMDFSRSLATMQAETSPVGVPTSGFLVNTDTNLWQGVVSNRPRTYDKNGGASVKVEHDFGTFRLMSLSAFRREFHSYSFPIIYGISQQDQRATFGQYSEEFQLQSPTQSKLQWVGGLYYLYATTNALTTQYLPPSPFAPTAPALPMVGNGKSYLTSQSAFGQVTAPLNELVNGLGDTNLTLGLRYTMEKRHLKGVGQVPVYVGSPIPTSRFALQLPLPVQKPRFDRFTWRIALDHHFTKNLMAYISESRGVKGGGFNLSSPFPAAMTVRVLPEILDSTEIGFKSEWLNYRLQVNGSAFLYQYNDLQTIQYDPGGGVSIINAPKAKVYGFDLDFQAAVTSRLTVTGGGEYLHPRFQSFPGANLTTPLPDGRNCFTYAYYGAALDPCTFDAKGKYIPYTSAYYAHLGVNYEIETASWGVFNFNVNDAFVGRYYSGPSNTLHQNPYHLLSASVAWKLPDNPVELRVWAKNLSNSSYATFFSDTNNGDSLMAAPPRTFGFVAQYSF